MKRIIVFAALIIIGCQSSKKTEELPFKQLTNSIDQYADNTLEKGNINSLAVAIYKDGQVYHNYYGNIHKDSKGIANDNSVYEIASVTKVFVGSLAAKAVLENKISLDDDIRDYLDGDYPNLKFEETPITIKNLLTHTLGFKNKRPKKLEEVENKISNGYYENRPIDYDISDFLQELNTIELDKKPGTFYRYNSIGPELVAYILEQVYNDSFENILEAFLAELDMKHTYLQNSRKEHSEYLVDGYTEHGKLAPRSKTALLGAGGGMLSTLPDLIKFMKFQFESDNPLIKESTKTLFENNDDDKLGYLWDVDVAEKEGFYYMKTGTSSGIQSVLLICPDTRYGLILIANSTSEKAYNDWALLYDKLETDLIMYPKRNLMSLLKDKFITDPNQAIIDYNKLAKEDQTYYTVHNNLSDALNNLGYEYLSENETKKAIQIFKLLISKYPENSNAYDSLGDAYLMDNDFSNALINYKKSLELNPNNNNAKINISKINELKYRD